MKALVGLSGGVDSAVAAAEAKLFFDEVVGVYLNLWGGEKHSNSCSTADSEAAEAVADELSIKLVKVDLRDEFNKKIVDPYTTALEEGRTLSPCIDCNFELKASSFLSLADELAVDKIITGHYARIQDGNLYRGHEDNDQSYFLWRWIQTKLNMFWFPNGARNKEETRKLAKRHNLSVHDKQDSTDLCFNPKKLIANPKSIPIIGDGVISGSCVKAGTLTVGQRRGLEVTTTDAEPRYVTNINAYEIILGKKEDLLCNSLIYDPASLILDPKISKVNVQRSSKGPVSMGHIDRKINSIIFSEPVRIVAPGQDAVFYDLHNCKVVGGCIIDGHLKKD